MYKSTFHTLLERYSEKGNRSIEQGRDEIDSELSAELKNRRFATNSNEAFLPAESAPGFLNDQVHSNILPVEYVQWRGRVIEIQDECFVARIDSVNVVSPSKIVTFSSKKTRIINSECIEEGATFYWTVGLFPQKQNSSTLVKRSEIRFRLLPPVDLERMNAYAAEKAREIIENISWLE